MGYENLIAGEYKATIVKWEIQEVEKLKSLKAVIYFELDDGTQITWDGFLFKLDGTVNLRTMKSLKTCGFNKKSVAQFMDSDALDKTKKVSVTVAKVDRYWQVEWINDGERAAPGKVSDVKVLQGYDLRKFDSALAMSQSPVTRAVKNHAPTLNTDDEIPF